MFMKSNLQLQNIRYIYSHSGVHNISLEAKRIAKTQFCIIDFGSARGQLSLRESCAHRKCFFQYFVMSSRRTRLWMDISLNIWYY